MVAITSTPHIGLRVGVGDTPEEAVGGAPKPGGEGLGHGNPLLGPLMPVAVRLVTEIYGGQSALSNTGYASGGGLGFGEGRGNIPRSAHIPLCCTIIFKSTP